MLTAHAIAHDFARWHSSDCVAAMKEWELSVLERAFPLFWKTDVHKDATSSRTIRYCPQFKWHGSQRQDIHASPKSMSDEMSTVQTLAYYYPTGKRPPPAVTEVQVAPIPWWAVACMAIGAFIALFFGFALLSWGLSRQHEMRRVKTNQVHQIHHISFKSDTTTIKPPPPLKVKRRGSSDPQLCQKMNQKPEIRQ